MSQRIVVVDDSRTVCGVVEWAYHGSGIEVLPALTGAEALTVVRKAPPLAVIVDYSLPDMTAAAFVAALRADAALAKVPVLLLTGGFHQVDTAAVMGAGADEELRKPFKTGDLLSRVQSIRDRGAARGYVAGVRVAAPPPLRTAAPPPLVAPPVAVPQQAIAPLIAPPPVVQPSASVADRPSGLVAPPPPAAPLVAPPPVVPVSASSASSFTAPPTSPRQPLVASPGVYGASSAPSSGAHRVTPPPPTGLRTEEREALLRALQPVVVEQVKGALPAIVREVLPAMLREVLGAVMREQLGAKVEEYSRQRVDGYVERELPAAAEAAIERYLSRLSDGGEENR